MFTAIELTNFRSFGHVRFDFEKKEKEYKEFIAIYGENGSGKSNFVAAIALLPRFLSSLADTFQLKLLKKYLEENKKVGHITDIQDMIKAYDTFSLNFDEYRTIGCEERTKIKYEFVLNGIKGYYEIAFRSEIEYEELYYFGSRQRGVLFSIEKQNENIEAKLNAFVIQSDYQDAIQEKIQQYWGKHSFLAIMHDEIHEKNKEYIENKVSAHLLNVMAAFGNLYIHCRETKYHQYGYGYDSRLRFRNFETIEIARNNQEDMSRLKLVEKIINDFYTQTYSDVVSAFYCLVDNEKQKTDTLHYELFLKKIIAGRVRDIPFSRESAGTQSVLEVLRAIIEVVNGRTVIYDEVDEGIHDLLMTSILTSVQGNFDGQFIVTTHNTTLLETIRPECAYVIYCDDNGNKEARCLCDYGIRIQKSHNMRKLYLEGVFGGIPYSDQIDYSSMRVDTKQ